MKTDDFRDPRLRPRAGDVVKGSCQDNKPMHEMFERVVVDVSGLGSCRSVTYREYGIEGQLTCSLRAWREWAKITVSRSSDPCKKPTDPIAIEISKQIEKSSGFPRPRPKPIF